MQREFILVQNFDRSINIIVCDQIKIILSFKRRRRAFSEYEEMRKVLIASFSEPIFTSVQKKKMFSRNKMSRNCSLNWK